MSKKIVKQMDSAIKVNEGHIEQLVYLIFIKKLSFNKTSSMTRVHAEV